MYSRSTCSRCTQPPPPRASSFARVHCPCGAAQLVFCAAPDFPRQSRVRLSPFLRATPRFNFLNYTKKHPKAINQRNANRIRNDQFIHSRRSFFSLRFHQIKKIPLVDRRGILRFYYPLFLECFLKRMPVVPFKMRAQALRFPRLKPAIPNSAAVLTFSPKDKEDKWLLQQVCIKEKSAGSR